MTQSALVLASRCGTNQKDQTHTVQQPQEQLQVKKWPFDRSDGKERKANVKACAIRPQGIKAENIKGGLAERAQSNCHGVSQKAERRLKESSELGSQGILRQMTWGEWNFGWTKRATQLLYRQAVG